MNYSEALDWLYSTQLFGIKLGLENPKRLLREYLAYPPRRTRVIHVAGTNGNPLAGATLDLNHNAGRRYMPPMSWPEVYQMYFVTADAISGYCNLQATF